MVAAVALATNAGSLANDVWNAISFIGLFFIVLFIFGLGVLIVRLSGGGQRATEMPPEEESADPCFRCKGPTRKIFVTPARIPMLECKDKECHWSGLA